MKLTAAELIKRSGIAKTTVYRWIQQGQLVPADIADDGKKLFSEEAIETAKAMLQTNKARRQKKIYGQITPTADTRHQATAPAPVSYTDKLADIEPAPADKAVVMNAHEPTNKPADVELHCADTAPVPTLDTRKKNNAVDTADDTHNISSNKSKHNIQQGGKTMQDLFNLPNEILSIERFVQSGNHGDPKAPFDGWNRPENQSHFSALDLDKPLGIVAATDRDDSLIFFDFDHVLDDDGNFVSTDAEKWFNYLHAEEYFCELSTNKHGLHMFAAPTVGKFTGGRRELKLGNGAKLEIFYGTNKFCLVTGTTFRCEPCAPIAQGDVADQMFQTILDAVKKQNPERKPARTESHHTPDTNEFNSFRARRMLDTIDPAALSYDEWLTVLSCCKNIGIDYATFDAWNSRDTSLNSNGKPRYNEPENLSHWNSNINATFGFNQLYIIAVQFGYDAKAAWQEWQETKPRPAPKQAETFANADTQADVMNDAFIWTRDRIKSCPVNLRLPEGFLFDLRGIAQIIPPKKQGGNEKIITVTRTPILPTRKFRDPTTGKLEYEFAIFSDDEWRLIEIESKAVSDPRAIIALADKGALILEPKLLCRFFADVISLNPDTIPRIKSYNQTGWNEDCDEFAYPTTPEFNAVIRRPGYDYERIFKPKGDPDAWKQKFVEVSKQGGTVARIVIGATCAASLVRPLELMNLQVHLWGNRSIGKTPLQKFSVSIYGDPKFGALTHTFAATPKSRLETAAAFRDLPLIFDELESLGKHDLEKLPEDVYNYSLGIGGQALKKDGTKRDPKLFSGARLTSGEHPINRQSSNGGQLKRVLDIHAPKLFEETFASSLHGFCNRNHGLFGAMWIRYITDNREVITEHYHKAFAAIRSRLAARGRKKDDTQMATLVIAAVAYQNFKNCVGLQDTGDDGELTADIETIANTLPDAAELDDTARAIDFLQSFVAGHEKFFAREAENENGKIESISPWTAESYGKIFANGEVAFLPHALKKILESDGELTSADKIIAELYDQDKLIHDRNKRTHKITLGDGRPRTIHFKANVIVTNKESSELDYYNDLGVV